MLAMNHAMMAVAARDTGDEGRFLLVFFLMRLYRALKGCSGLSHLRVTARLELLRSPACPKFRKVGMSTGTIQWTVTVQFYPTITRFRQFIARLQPEGEGGEREG